MILLRPLLENAPRPLAPALLLPLLASVLAACAAEPAARTGTDSAAPLLEQIRAEIGDAACSSDQQCRSLAIGAKPCGGPESFVAWSVQRSDAARLERLATAYRKEREAENARERRVSNCMFVADPGAQCKAGRCVTGSLADPVLR
jgi:hypothetical protein